MTLSYDLDFTNLLYVTNMLWISTPKPKLTQVKQNEVSAVTELYSKHYKKQRSSTTKISLDLILFSFSFQCYFNGSLTVLYLVVSCVQFYFPDTEGNFLKGVDSVSGMIA